ncbi:MAG: sugar phosphate isomerase/epimerase [Ruminococcaceae bacterium]|nr:sugar phosphate isomerase/epimerase [Oscillospiraceae bacterium]
MIEFIIITRIKKKGTVIDMKTAIQIYGLRNHLGDEIKETLKRISGMGYDGVEWIGVAGRTLEELAEMSKEAGLEIFSRHIGINEILQRDEEFLDTLKTLGFKYLPIGALPADRRAGGDLFNETLKELEIFCALAKEKGLYVMYHNHDFDLNYIKDTDKRELDVLLDSVSEELLGAELDTCWLYSGGVDPAGYIAKYKNRAPVIHLKDCVKEGGRSGYRSVGTGVLDFEGILKECDKAEWLCVEQDAPAEGLDEFECARISAENLNKLLGR